MAYEKTTWVDGETEIDAQKLNKIEEGIVEASQTGGILTGTIVAYDGDTIPEGYEEVDGLNNIQWKNATLNSDYISSGTCKYFQIGNIVVVNFDSLVFSTDIADGTNAILTTELPLSTNPIIGLLQQSGTNYAGRIRIDGGTVYTWYTPFATTTTPNTWYGTFVYLV